MTMKWRVKKLEKQVPAKVPKLLVDWGDGKAEDADMVVISWAEEDRITVTRPRRASRAEPENAN
jgi:hypothetical protein